MYDQDMNEINGQTEMILIQQNFVILGDTM